MTDPQYRQGVTGETQCRRDETEARQANHLHARRAQISTVTTGRSPGSRVGADSAPRLAPSHAMHSGSDANLHSFTVAGAAQALFMC